MITYVVRRILFSVPVVLLSSFVLFAATRATFDPLAKLRQSRDPTVLQRETERLGLTRSVPEQYLLWLKGVVTGDWGVSTRTGEAVRPMIWHALSPTLQLILWGILFAVMLAASVSVYSAVRRYSAGDLTLTAISYVGIALPAFWFGLVLIQLLSVAPRQRFGLAQPPLYFVGLHSTGRHGFNLDYVRHLVLPVLTLTVTLVASWSRFGRTAMLDALSSDYVRTARAKGVPRRQVILRHAARNSLAPFVTVVSLDAALLFGGLLVTEQIYSIPGMGRLFLDSLLTGDVFVLLPWMLVVAVAVIVCNLLADIGYALLDPRVRLQ